MPHEARAGSPQGYTLEFTLDVALEIDWNRVGTAFLTPLITGALNQHAGGNRDFRGTPVYVSWSLSWVPTVRVPAGRALGVSLVPDEVLSSAHAGGMFLHAESGGSNVNRILLKAGTVERLQRRRGSTRRSRRAASMRMRRSASHEIGHALGLDDERRDAATTMYYRGLTSRQLRRIDQRWSDAELRQALRNVFPPADRPAWLR
jgi:hypothetical protein